MPTSMEAQKKPQQEPENKSPEIKPQQVPKIKPQQDKYFNLLELTMKGKWDEVVEQYKSDPSIHNVKITRSGDTALHIAVLYRKEDIVEKLVRLIDGASAATEQGDDSAETPKDHPLKIENEQGDTPLHLAASIGNVPMCSCITDKHKDLVGARNKLTETPFFLAALHGKKDAFLCLHKICGVDKGYVYCRKDNGETILHCTIAGDYLDLAYHIIEKYPKLANYYNEEGDTPLHLLASKPAVFRSGSHLGFFNKIIYHCIYVKKLEVKEDSPPLDNATSNGKKVDGKCPMNYQTCMNFLNVLTVMWNMLTRSGQTIPKNQDTSDENLKEQTRNCIKGLRNITSKMAATCGKNSQKSDSQAKPDKHDTEDPEKGHASASQNQGKEAVEDQLCPPNYYIFVELVKFIYTAVMVGLGIGSTVIKKIHLQKEKDVWSVQIMNKLLDLASSTYYDSLAGSGPDQLDDHDFRLSPENEQKGPNDEKAHANKITLNFEDKRYVLDMDFSKEDITLELAQENKKQSKKETPILIAAKNGITEMVKEILNRFPVAIRDMNSENKNPVLLAAEHRQPEVYKLLLEREILTETILHAVDNEGNSALHLAAMATHHLPWLLPGAALQMQWEIKWYEYVKDSLPMHLTAHYNKANKTAREIFTEKHEELVKSGSKWLINTSNSCSVVAALIATVAYAASTTVPGGPIEGKGTPILQNKPAFSVFSISSLIALCSSVNSLVMFLGILTSRHQEMDFGSNLPNKLLFGLSSLLISIAAMLVSFCAGHFFVLKDDLKHAAFPIYTVTCLPVAFFAVMQFPLYLDLIWAIFTKVPQRRRRAVS